MLGLKWHMPLPRGLDGTSCTRDGPKIWLDGLKSGLDGTPSSSHGFNIIEEGMQIRDVLSLIMVAPKCPGTVFGVPTLIADNLRGCC